MPRLKLGPVLRHVDEDSATVWVETDAPATVAILGGSERTWSVSGHHYALVEIAGLAPGSSTAYDVRLDGEVVWPPADTAYPSPLIRTRAPDQPLRMIYGSCRYASPETASASMEDDALAAYAAELVTADADRRPDLLLMLGDQVYADETSDAMQDFIASRRDLHRPPGADVADFCEYTKLYEESWGDPAIRWLLSTVPTAMIFDDHDVRDDWNTSESWRAEMKATDWWQERIVSGLSSYWVYQHIGNLSSAQLRADPIYDRVRASGDATAMVRGHAAAADRVGDGEPGPSWSYGRDIGRVRLLVLDTRAGRVVSARERAMLCDGDFAWLEGQLAGAVDHVVIGTSLPWLMPPALHELETATEAIAAGSRGPRLAGLGEKARRASDLEHWAAFRTSFDRLAAAIGALARGERGPAPATICVLSGDVHHAYVARARIPSSVSRVYQLVCSPMHNEVQEVMHLAFRLSWSRAMTALVASLRRLGKGPGTDLTWERSAGPFFGNEIATLVLDGREATASLQRVVRRDGRVALETVDERSLTS
ncbi:MAG: alkaline phosphatase D family protein [Mycobacteriales bacterium]